MNNYRKTFPYLTITGLLLSIVACNPFPTNLQPEIVEDPMITISNPAPNQSNAQITLLFEAIDTGDIKGFQDVWSQLKATNPTIDFSQFTDELGNTLLHRAAEKGNILLLEFLLFHSIDKNTYINAINYLEQTPLHIAVMNKHLDSIERLIAAGADPMVYDPRGFTPLHIATIDGNLDIVERLTQGNNVMMLIGLPTKVEGNTAIRLAYMKKHTDVLRHLMNLKYYKSNEKLANEELLIALKYEWIDLIEELIKEKRIEVTKKGILQLAANKGYLPFLEYLIDQLGKDINQIHDCSKKDIKNTAAYQAVRGSHPKALHYLLGKGAKQYIEGYTDLLEIALNKYIEHKQEAIGTQDTTTLNTTGNGGDKKVSNAKEIINIILANRRANFDLSIITTPVDEKKRYILSPRILILASRAGEDIFKSVLSHSYTSNRRKIVTAIRGGYCSPIHEASKAGDTNLVKYLVSMKANINAENSNGTTPLIHAVKSGNTETVQYLLTQGATVNVKEENDHTPLYQAVKVGSKAIFDELLNYRANIHDEEDDGNTLLHAAALSKNVVSADTTETQISIQDIIARIGVKRINVKDPSGFTPLHYAAQGRNQSLVRALLAAGADPNVQTNEDETPLDFALSKANLATAKQLLVAGANLYEDLFNDRNMRNKLLKLILFILKDEEEIIGENIILVNKLLKKADEIVVRKLILDGILTANGQPISLLLKCFCDQLIKEHNIQLKDCLAIIIAGYQNNYETNHLVSYQADYQLTDGEILFFMYRLIEEYGLSPVDCISQLILSKKVVVDPLLCNLIKKYKVSPLHLLNNAITEGREDIVSLLIGPYYDSLKNIIIKQGVATNDLGLISRLIQYDKDNGSWNNVNYIISQAKKLNKLDIVQFLITQCPLDPKMVVADLIKEISNTIYSADMYKFAQDLMAMNRLYPEDFAIWAAAADEYEVVRYMLIQYNLSLQQLIDYAIKMNNEPAASFLTNFSDTKKAAFSETGLGDSNIDPRPIKKQKK